MNSLLSIVLVAVGGVRIPEHCNDTLFSCRPRAVVGVFFAQKIQKMTSLIVFKDQELAAKIAEAVREIARIEREIPILKATATKRQARAELSVWQNEKRSLENEQRRAEQPRRNRAR